MPTDYTLTDLREETPEAERASASLASRNTAAPTVATAEASTGGNRDQQALNGQASGYSAVTGEVNPDTMTASGQMTSITGQDSPMMRRARQEGLLTAGKRGLGNSSIAAGTAMGAMVDRATPLALQDAQTYWSNMRANLDAQNRAAEVSTGRETDVSMFNAQAASEMERLQRQLETAVSQQNAEMANQAQRQIDELNARVEMQNAEMQTNVSLQNANAQNELTRTTLVGNQELNRQFLAGEQAADLATIQARYSAIISQNETAANMYNSMIQGLSTMMSNPDVKPDRIASYVRTLTNQLEGGLEFLDSINSIDFETGQTVTQPPPPTGVAPPGTNPPIAGAPTGGTTTTSPTNPYGIPQYGTPEWQQWVNGLNLNLGNVGL